MTFDAAPATPTFPGQPLDARVELQLNGAWTDVSPYVWMDSTSIGRGHPDESTTAAPSTFAATLNNSDGRFSQTNAVGPYYPHLGLNTPIRVSIPEGSSYLYLENDSNSGATCPAPSAMTSLASFEVWLDVDNDNWRGSRILAAQWASSGNERSWMVYTADAGVALFISTDGTVNNTAGAISAYFLPVHGRTSIRISYNGSTVSFYQGVNCANWKLISASPMSGTPYHSTAPIEVGNAASLTDYNSVLPPGASGANGKLYAFALINGAGNPVTSAYCSADFTAQASGATGFTDGQGNAWSLEGTSVITDRRYRFYGQVAAWPQSWTPGDPNATVALAAGGKLRQLGQSQVSVNSAMYRAYMRLQGVGTVPWGYWPCEDGSGATVVASAIGGKPGTWNGSPSVSNFNGFACSAALPTLGSGSTGASLTCVVPRYPESAGVAMPTGGGGTNGAAVIRWLMAVPSNGDTNGGNIARIYFDANSTVAQADLTYGTGGSLALVGYNTAGTQLFNTGAIGFAANGQNCRFSVEFQNITSSTYNAVMVMQNVVGGNSSTLLFYAQGSSTTGVSGSIGNVTRVVFNPNATLTSTAVGHITVQSAWTSLFNLASPLQAWSGELSANRFARLCGEEGIQARIVGNPATSTPMGVQTQETIATLLQECADADRGFWYEPAQFLGFAYRTRVNIGNQIPALVLNYALDELAGSLSPTHDDQTVKNDVTITNQQSGSTAELTLNDGSAMSIGAVGRYDTQVTINLAGDWQNTDEAGWILHASTVNEPRYTAINVDLANTALASLYYTILGVDIGDRVQVANPPSWLPPGNIDQIVQGATETLSLKDLQESWNGVPATPWNTAYLDQDAPGNGTADDPYAYARCDTDGSLLVNSPTAAGTTLAVATLNATSPLWTTSASDFPFDVSVGGEQVSVTNIAALGAVSVGVADGTFESGITGWGTSSGTIAQSTAQAHSGTHSLLATTGASSGMNVQCSAGRAPAIPGMTYTVSMWVFAPVAASYQPIINWRNAAGGFVSGVSPSVVAVPASAWTQLTVSGVAPSGVANATYGIDLTGTVSNGTQFFLDDVTITTPAQAFTVIRAVNGVSKPQVAGQDVRLFIQPTLGM